MSMNRRSFLKVSAAVAASLPVVSRLLSGGEAWADASLPFPKEGEEPAKSLKFCANADKPSKNCAARKAKDKDGQYCYNCQLFTKAAGDKKSSSGRCMILPKNSVPGIAWCQSWVKSPTA